MVVGRFPSRWSFPECRLERTKSCRSLIPSSPLRLRNASRNRGAGYSYSIASAVFRKLAPKKLDYDIWAPTFTSLSGLASKTNIVDAVVGRSAPILGWGLPPPSALDISVCTTECASCGGD